MADWQVIEVGGLASIQQRLILNGRDIVGRTMDQVLAKRLPEAVQYARANYLTGGTTSTRLAERTGRLKTSFDYEIFGTPFVTGRIGYIKSPPIYAAVHEGWPDRRSTTTIRPKQARYLTIPLTEEARRHRARDFTNTFVQKSRATGALLIFQKTAGGGIAPLYLLKTEVTIPSRPALYPTMDIFVPMITQDLREALARALRGS